MSGAPEPIAPVELRHCLAPAKLNLFLHVLAQREDGYHELETVFELVDLFDTLSFSIRSDGAIMRRGGVHGLAHDNDLSVRAARLLATASETRHGVDIAIDKRIPMGGGLGGGSSNAATTLLALNRLWQVNWPVARLARLSAQLGADVPVFVQGTAAFAEGVGEKLTPLTLDSQSYVIVAPPVTVPTAEIFSAPELTRDSKPLKILPLSRLNVSLIESIGRNDLQAVAFDRYPAVETALKALTGCAAEILKEADRVAKAEARARAKAVKAEQKAAEQKAAENKVANEAAAKDSKQESKASQSKTNQDKSAAARRESGQASDEDSEAEERAPGARWSSARMSGSGGCVFLPVPSHELAEQIAQSVNKLGVGDAVAVRSLKMHPMRSWAFGRGLPRKS